jgi:hypothetical protein
MAGKKGADTRSAGKKGAEENKITQGENTTAQVNEAPVSKGKAPKGPKMYIYYSRYGNLRQPVTVEGKGGLEKKYAQFRDNKYSTSDKDIASALENIISSDDEAGRPLEQRNVLNEDQYFESVTPERLWVPYEGQNYHISVIRGALDFAIEKGYILKAETKLVIQNTHSRVRSGDAVTAGSISG